MKHLVAIEPLLYLIGYIIEILLVISRGYATFWNVLVMAAIAIWVMEPRTTERSK